MFVSQVICLLLRCISETVSSESCYFGLQGEGSNLCYLGILLLSLNSYFQVQCAPMYRCKFLAQIVANLPLKIFFLTKFNCSKSEVAPLVLRKFFLIFTDSFKYWKEYLN